MAEFIFMLTHNDRTVDNAMEVLNSLEGSGLTEVGFKDVGATPELQRSLTERAHELGMTVYLEIVSVDAADELQSVDAAIAAGVDWIVGGKFVEQALERLAGTGIKFAPFPGRVVGHPSELQGSIEEIASHAAQLVALDGVHGVDILAYRNKSVDVPELIAATVKALGEYPTIVAGSVTTEQQIKDLTAAGAWGFTIGGAIFDGVLPGEKDVVSQVKTALQFAANA
jgi:uncharacterized protein related to proFAR isomerase